MKKTGVINSELSRVISELGHTDTIVIGDSGLPIPPGVRRIDLALRKGVPGYLETLETILEEMQVESYIVAAEMEQISPELYQATAKLLSPAHEQKMTHEQFKQETKKSRAVIRTGEFTPYANVILQAGVTF